MNDPSPKSRTRTLRQKLASLLDLLAGSSEDERQYRQLCKARDPMSDEQFIARYYPLGIDRDVIRGVRHVLAEQLGLDSVEPADRPCEMIDVDLGEIMFEIAELFSLEISDREMVELDGSVDSMIRWVSRRLDERNPTSRP